MDRKLRPLTELAIRGQGCRRNPQRGTGNSQYTAWVVIGEIENSIQREHACPSRRNWHSTASEKKSAPCFDIARVPVPCQLGASIQAAGNLERSPSGGLQRVLNGSQRNVLKISLHVRSGHAVKIVYIDGR